MQVCGLPFTRRVRDEITRLVEADASISRRELSRRLCKRYDWRSRSGKLKAMSCRKALAHLDRQGLVSLPPAEPPSALQKRRRRDAARLRVAAVDGSIEDLGVVSVTPVTRRRSERARQWRALLDTHHDLGSGPLCGAQLRYLVESSLHGPIGALAFTSAAYKLAARDRHIGWSVAARCEHIDRVVCNARFLIAPSVRVPNLASHVLARALARLPDDWHARYGVRPVLAETFVDPRRYAGTSYRAAGWVEVGETAGRRDGIKKRIFLRGLCHNWRRVLSEEPDLGLGTVPAPEDPAHWAEQEFGRARIFDARLKRRLYRVAQDFYSNSTATIPEACGSKARTMGAYRLFANSAITMDVILTPHTEATVDRIRAHRGVVLAPQDTTTLKYNTRPMTQGLGPTNTSEREGLGLLLHDTLAFTEDGTPLGVLDAQCWARDPESLGKKYTRHKRPIEEKESSKWLRSFRRLAEIQKLVPEATLVSIGDRESDIFPLLQEATQDPDGPRLLVRSERTRSRKTEDGELWEAMAARAVDAAFELHIPRRGSRRARDAKLQVRYGKVTLQPPRKHASAAPIPLWAVYLVETAPPEDLKRPVEWLLLTTAALESVEDARRVVAWYAARWGIEVYHRTLKSGCRIGNRQLGTADSLEACIGVDMVVAWRIYHLAMLGRETPDVPCTAYFDDIEWKSLCSLITWKPDPPEEPPTMSEAVHWVGKLGGHLGRKGDGPPGTQTLWKGLQRLDSAVVMAKIHGLYGHPPERPPP